MVIYKTIAELSNRISVGNKGGLILNPSTELNSFKQMLRDLDIPPEEINNLAIEGTPGDYRLSLNGQAVDIAKGTEDIMYNANLLNFLKRLGLTKTATAMAKEAEIKDEYLHNARGFHQIMRLKNRMKIANDITKRYGKSPATDAELREILQKDPYLKSVFVNFLRKIQDSRNSDPNAKPYGDWVRKPYRGRRYGLVALFRILNNHKLSLGGCWAMRVDGYKCVVPSLSCSTIKGQKAFKCADDNRCGVTKKQSCYKCVKWNSNMCVETPSCDKNNSCSKACSNKEIEVPSDTVLVCIKRKFWIAAQDFMNQDFTMVSGPPVVTDDDVVVDDDENVDVEDDENVDVEDDEFEEDLSWSSKLADFFGYTWLIWVIGFIIVGIVMYRYR
jgi:hypothetical protein